MSTDRLANGAMSVGLRIARSGRIPRIDPSASDGTHRVQPNGNVVGPTTTTAVEMTALETIAKIAAMTIATMTASPRVEKTERIVETAILMSHFRARDDVFGRVVQLAILLGRSRRGRRLQLLQLQRRVVRPHLLRR